MRVLREKVELRLIESRPIRELSGFDRSLGHTIPKNAAAVSQEYLRTLIAPDLSEELQVIYERAKRILRIRRHQMQKELSENYGSLETPDFSYTLEFSPCDLEPGHIRLDRRIYLKKSISELSTSFFEVFPFLPEEVVYPLEGALDFDELVYRFEELEIKRGGLLKDDDRNGSIEYRQGDQFLIRVSIRDKELSIASRRFDSTLSFYKESELLVDLLS